LALVAAVFALTHDAELRAFNNWATKFDKSYESEAAFEHAFHNYMASVERVASNNKRTGKHYYGLTKFADMSPQEFKTMYLRCNHANRAATADMALHNVAPRPPRSFAAPSKFDWRDHNAVTDVKDQGQCGSCWAFSATENIESMNILKGHDSVKLSPEQIVDCDTTDQGCNGGDTPTAFAYVTAAGGLDTDASYPYTAGGGQAGPCNFSPSSVGAKINNFTWAIPACIQNPSCDNQDVNLLRNQLASIAPFAICVYAQTWQDYQSGIFDDSTCTHDYNKLDHCVQLVGYDWDAGYWLVRNSWNTNWGESGYIRISNTAANGNLCGVADEVNFANAL